jgi:hypothetical protein
MLRTPAAPSDSAACSYAESKPGRRLRDLTNRRTSGPKARGDVGGSAFHRHGRSRTRPRGERSRAGSRRSERSRSAGRHSLHKRRFRRNSPHAKANAPADEGTNRAFSQAWTR